MVDDVIVNKASVIERCVARVRALGVPQCSRHAFGLLAEAGLIERGLAEDLQRMVGFRNVAVHRYRELALAGVHGIVREKLVGIEAFASATLRACG